MTAPNVESAGLAFSKSKCEDNLTAALSRAAQLVRSFSAEDEAAKQLPDYEQAGNPLLKGALLPMMTVLHESVGSLSDEQILGLVHQQAAAQPSHPSINYENYDGLVRDVFGNVNHVLRADTASGLALSPIPEAP